MVHSQLKGIKPKMTGNTSRCGENWQQELKQKKVYNKQV
jgi:hypothetical protein